MAQKKNGGDAGEQEVQQRADEASEQGFIGVKADPRPNSDYSLESGAKPPSSAESLADAHEAQAKALRDSQGDQSR